MAQVVATQKLATVEGRSASAGIAPAVQLTVRSRTSIRPRPAPMRPATAARSQCPDDRRAVPRAVRSANATASVVTPAIAPSVASGTAAAIMAGVPSKMVAT
jgi:hypothetical protein